MSDPYGKEVAVLDGEGSAGLQSVTWNFRQAGPGHTPPPPQGGGRGQVRLAPPGDYVVTLEIGDRKWSQLALVRPPPERW